MPSGDPYNYRAPGFIPDESNSLPLQESDGRKRSLTELGGTLDALRAELRQNPAFGDDSDVIVYDGDLYIVGGYVRRLMESDDA